jgi:nicotinate-nucleotide adenylyltransferase
MDRSVIAAVDSFVNSLLSRARYAHSRSTAELAGGLCLRFGVEEEKGYVSGLAHDAAREIAPGELVSLAARDRQPVTEFERKSPILLHGRAAAVLLAENTGYSDPDVLQAIRDHVTGRPSMGMLSKIVFTADFLEPTRDFLPRDFRMRALASALDVMVLAVLERKIQYVETGSTPVAEASRSLFEELKRNAR